MRFHRTLVPILALALVTALPLAAREPSTPEAWLAKAEEALDGSTHYFDRRGNPAESMAYAERAEELARAADRADLVHEALMAQAWAAAAGGDYGRALEFSDEIEEMEGLGEGEKEQIAFLRHVWEIGYSQIGLVFNYSLDLQLHRPAWLPFISSTELEKFPDLATRLQLVSAIHFMAQGRSLLQTISRHSEPQIAAVGADFREVLSNVETGIEKHLCASARTDSPCLLLPLLLARVYVASGSPAKAEHLLRVNIENLEAKEAKSNRHDFRRRGMTRLALADVLMAPKSSPLTLDLRFSTSGADASQNSLGVAAEDLRPLEEMSLPVDEINHLLDDAHRDFLRARCMRCLPDVGYRRAFLEWREAPKELELGKIISRYEELGDEALAWQVSVVSFSSGATLGGSIEDLPEAAPWGHAMFGAHLSQRLAELHWQRDDWPKAKFAFDKALYWARAALPPDAKKSGARAIGRGAPHLLLMIARRASDLLRAMGRNLEADLLLEQQALGGIETLMTNKSDIALFQLANWTPPNTLANPFIRLEVLQALFSSAVANSDLSRARLYLERMKNLADAETEPSGLHRINKIVQENRRLLKFQTGRYGDLLDDSEPDVPPSLLAMAHLASLERKKAASVMWPTGLARLERLKAALEELSPGGASFPQELEIQTLRQDLERAITILTVSRHGEEAFLLWALAEGALLGKYPDSSTFKLFGTNQGEPWRQIAAMALIHEAKIGKAISAAQSWDLYRSAKEYYQHTWEIIRDQSVQVADVIDQSRFWDQTKHVIDDAIRFNATNFTDFGVEGSPWQALNLFEKSRGVMFRFLTNQVVSGLGEQGDWWRRRGELEAKLANEVRLESRSLANEESTSIPEATDLKSKFSLLYAVDSGDEDAPNPIISGLLQAEPGDRALRILVYHSDRWGDRIFVLSQSGNLEVRELSPDGVRTPETPKLRALSNDLRNRLESREEGWIEPARVLHDYLIEPIRDLLPPANETGPRSRLIIIPYQSLHLIPFGVLPDAKGRLLLEGYDISYAPNLQFLLDRIDQGPTEALLDDPLAVGFDGSLQNASGEAMQVGEILELDGSAVLTGPAADPKTVLDGLDQASMAHLATHTLLKEQNPFWTQLEMQNRSLPLYELLGRDLSNLELAVLSACVTGVNDYSRSDEIIGLARIVLATGARSVIASLWRISDEGLGPFWALFYEGLKAGQSPREALREAQLARHREGIHPGSWAAFSYVGGIE